MALMAVTGYGLMYQVVATNTIVQTIVDDDKRGRVMSFYTIALAGSGPIGSLRGRRRWPHASAWRPPTR